MGLLAGCSVRRMAVNRLGDALAAQGTTFSSENDPQLVRAAAPFSLKLMESLLAENPRHYGLLRAAASSFTQFSYAFVQQDADEMETTDLEAAGAMKARARLLYLRARDYGLRGLGVKHPHFDKLVRENPKKAAQLAGVKDVPLLYWTSASWAAAI